MATATAVSQNGKRFSPASSGEERDERSLLDETLAETERRRSIAQEAADKVGVKTVPQLFKLLRMLWKTKGEPFTDAELYQAVSLIARYDLDPLVREIYCNRDKHGRVMVIVGIDGWIKILHRTDGYDGHEQTIEWDENGDPLSATTTIYSKNRSHPVTYVAFWKEYVRVGGFVKDQMPSHMLRVFSLRHAARQFAPIGGNVLTEAEAMYLAENAAPMERRGSTSDARSASDELADILENGRRPATATSGESDDSTDEPASEDAAGDEPAGQETEYGAEIPARDLSLMIGDEERPIDYVARLKKSAGEAQSGEALDRILSALQACWDRLDNAEAQYKAVEKAVEKRRDSL